MKIKTISFSLAIMMISLSGCTNLEAKDKVELWYEQPAKEWMSSVPIGNGRIGAMVFGGIEEETIALNESSMWSGQYDENQEIPFGKERMNELRKLFFEGKIQEGNQIAGEFLHGNGHSFGTHLPIGDLKLTFSYPENTVSNYRRSLDLGTAISTTNYTIGDVNYVRECFATNPDDVLVLRMSASKKKAINAKLSLSMLRESEISTDGNQLIFEGTVNFPKQGPGGVSFQGRIAISAPNGTLQAEDSSISVNDADMLTIVIDVRTNYKNDAYKSLCKETVVKAEKKTYEKLKKTHLNDYTPLFDRVSLQLGTGEYAGLPTDKRWEQVKKGGYDPGLDVLLFQYGRYLLRASSRENSPLPAALQGFFNDNLACNMGWTNDYHLDINTQQNYWIANVGNLAECHLPLFKYIEDLSVHGAKTAQKIYGCKGWTAHTTANIWGYTAPSGSILWGLFPTASSWIASHLWTQYEYTRDKDYLTKTAYPLLKGNAEFLLDYMVEDPNTGYMVTGPSISPENSFLYQGNNLCASMMPTCDRVLAYEIFNACIQSAQILNIDKEFSDSLQQAIKKFPPIRLRANGGVREWLEDYDEAHPNHRHTSHLLALYPYEQITLDKTPELAAGARKTIEDRLAAEGWEDTEWSRANMICFYARLKDTKQAYQSVLTLESIFTRENLLSISPAGIAGAPYDIFILDGNTAGAAGIAEMLVQGHEGYIEFLPCLPEQWNVGTYKGLCVKGGAEVSAAWNQSLINEATLKATADNTFTVKVPQGKNYTITLNNKRINPVINNGLITVSMKAKDILKFK